MDTHTHTHTHTYIYICVHILILSFFFLSSSSYSYLNKSTFFLSFFLSYSNILRYICTYIDFIFFSYVRIYIYIYIIYIYIYIYIYIKCVYVFAGMYTSTNRTMNKRTYIHTHAIWNTGAHAHLRANSHRQIWTDTLVCTDFFFAEGWDHPQWLCWIWHWKIWWWGSSNSGALGNTEYPFIAITTRLTLARSGNTW